MKEPAITETMMLFGGNKFNVMDYAPNLPVKEDKTKRRKRGVAVDVEQQSEQPSVEQAS